MKVSIKKWQKSTLTIAVSAALTTSAAYAEDTKKESSGIERIQVTTQKKVESIQDVGIAVSALSGEDLARKGISNVTDMAGALSNVELQDISGGGLPTLIVRGIGLQDIRANNTPTTPFYIDEVYQASIAQAAFTMFDLERVEILKGPQGGLYGRNATGGAVQVISNKPEFESANGYVKAGIGKWNKAELEGAYGKQLSDTVAIRVSGKSLTSDDTYTHSVTENKDHGEADVWGGRFLVRFRPTDDLDILLKIHGGEDKSETDLLRSAAVFAGNTAYKVPGISVEALTVNTCDVPGAASCYTMNGQTHQEQGIAGNVHHSTSSTLPRLNNSWNGLSLRIDWSLGDYDLTSITAKDSMDHGRDTDFDGQQFEAQHLDYRSELDSTSQELRLSHSEDNYSWIIGASHGKDDIVENTVLNGAQGALQAFGLTSVDQNYVQESTSTSIYGHLDYAINERLTAIAELRYTDEEKSMVGGSFVPNSGGIALSKIDDSISFDAVSGKLGLTYQVNEDAMFYANLSRGFKSGGFPGGIATNAAALVPYEQETVYAIELGSKTEWMDNRVRLNGAIFHYDYQDQQGIAQITNELTGEGVIKKLTNLGDTKVVGAEIDLTLIPADGWYIEMNLGFTDAKINDSEFFTKDTFVGSRHPDSDLALQGARLPNVADWSFNTTIGYEHELSESVLGIIQVGYALKDDTDLSLAISSKEQRFYNEDGYGLADIRYTVMDIDEVWSLSAYIKNATDKQYRTTARPDGLNGFYEMYGAPRSFGVTFTYNWE